MKTFMLKQLAAAIILFSLGCQNNRTENQTTEGKSKETFSISNLAEEKKGPADSAMIRLHAQHHSYKVLGSGALPDPVIRPSMKYYAEYAVPLDKLPVINPGPGEHVHVMEGQRHGYNNLTIGITETLPGGAPPMHTHNAEESHVLLDGEILYALGDTMFTIKGPYVVNIPVMKPHAFKNVGNKTANVVVIFPSNVWQYDVVDYFPFDKKSDTVSKN